MPGEAAEFSHCTCVAEVDLESLLGAFSYPAIIIDRKFRIRTANDLYRQLYHEEPPVCGRTCYEVSHGEHQRCDEAGEECPLAEAVRVGHSASAVHVHFAPDGPQHVEVVITPLASAGGNGELFLEIVKPITSPGDPMPEGRVVGASKSFRRALSLARCAVGRDVPVLLIGESGTGKEVVAETIHRLSLRRDAPFVAMDCSAISASLFESELLGHERGSFTGATELRRGLVESAHRGTLFLDEVGDIPLSLQVKLLRLLETKTYRRVGGDKLMTADFRLVCATHRNLAEMVEEGTFRRDLFYRINAFPIVIPPLRDRLDDLPLLIDHFRNRFQCGSGCRPDREAMHILHSYSFPGNVRELANIVQRGCLLAEGGTITPDHLPSEVRKPSHDHSLPDLWAEVVPLRDVEQRYLLWAFGRFGRDHGHLAELLGISKRTLYRRLRAARRGKTGLARGGNGKRSDGAPPEPDQA